MTNTSEKRAQLKENMADPTWVEQQYNGMIGLILTFIGAVGAICLIVVNADRYRFLSENIVINATERVGQYTAVTPELSFIDGFAAIIYMLIFLGVSIAGMVFYIGYECGNKFTRILVGCLGTFVIITSLLAPAFGALKSPVNEKVIEYVAEDLGFEEYESAVSSGTKSSSVFISDGTVPAETVEGLSGVGVKLDNTSIKEDGLKITYFTAVP